MPDHADEDVASSIERLNGSRFHRELHQPSNARHDHLHQTPVVEDIDDGAEVDDDRKHLIANTNSHHNSQRNCACCHVLPYLFHLSNVSYF